MPSDIDIASNALILIGDDPISSFADEGAGPRNASALYPETKKAVISEQPWTFALKEQFLNRLSQTPEQETGYSFAYQVPTDLIRIWAVFPHSLYVRVGDLLYSNQTTLLCRYVFDVDETAIPPHVVKAIEYKLASELSIPVAEDRAKAEFYEQKYIEQARKAMSIDSQGQPSVPIIDSPFVDVRSGGGSLSDPWGRT
jgi:hypothetical protein